MKNEGKSQKINQIEITTKKRKSKPDIQKVQYNGRCWERMDEPFIKPNTKNAKSDFF